MNGSELWSVWCWRSGEAMISRKDQVPEEGLEIISHHDKQKLREALEVCAVHGWEAGKLFVPGIPIASDDDAAVKCALDFRDMLAKRLNPE